MTVDERDPIVMADAGPLIRLAAAGLVEWDAVVGAVTAIEEVAKTFPTKGSFLGEINSDEPIDLRRMPQLDGAA